MPAAQATEANPRLAIGANDPPAEAKLSITDLIAQSPAIVLTDEAKRAELFAHIEAEISDFDADLTTAKGRAAIKSFAFDITKMKTAIDGAGKTLNEEARAQINIVDAARRITKGRLEALSDLARKPLTEWEEAEERRVSACHAIIAGFKRDMVVSLDDTAKGVRKRGEAVYGTVIDAETFGDLFDEAQAAKDLTVETLKAARARLIKEEADRAELEKLRLEAAERAERDRLAAEEAARVEAAKEAARREAEEEAAYEERRIAAEKAEAERIERAKEEAAAAARREAEEAAQREREEVERAKQAELDAANERARKAEEDAQAERVRAAAAEAERQRLADEEAAARTKREADQAHRTKVKAAAKQAIMSCGVDEDTARKIVTLIIAGEVPAVKLSF